MTDSKCQKLPTFQSSLNVPAQMLFARGSALENYREELMLWATNRGQYLGRTVRLDTC